MARRHCFPVSIYGDDDRLVIFTGDAFWWILIPLLFPGCGVSVGVDGASGEDPRMRFVGLYLLAFGMGLLCTTSGFAFLSQRLHRRCRIFWAFAIDWWWRRQFPAVRWWPTFVQWIR